MKIKEYCDALSTELSVWKDELYDIVKVVDNLPERDRELMAPQLSSVRLLIEKIGKEIDRLKQECPHDWETLNREAGALT